MFRHRKPGAEFNRILMIVTTVLAIVGNARANFVFGEPINLGPVVNTSAHDGFNSLSADGLELYLGSADDLWVTKRTTINDDWSKPANLGLVNSAAYDGAPCLSGDGLSLYFDSMRLGGYGPADIWVTRRASKNDPWGAPENLGAPVNTSGDEGFPAIASDGLELYFADFDPIKPGGQGGRDLWMTKRSSVSDAWEPPVNAGPVVNSASHDIMPSLSADGLILLFTSRRPGGHGERDIWLARRTTTSDPWGSPVNAGPTINTSTFDQSGVLSTDGSTLYFSSWRPGGHGGIDLWQAPVLPVVDLNGDGVVNVEDMSIMIHYWGQNEPSCDIGPMPWGDGIVDVEDLIVLAEHLEPGFELTAHWKLDEEARAIAHDSVGGSDATVVGGATWRPEGGLVDGALELDGVDDHLDTGFVADPKAGPVRVVCWVKTEVGGGVIASQTPSTAFGSTWLATDAADGTLLTEMMFPLPALHSTYVVADGQWHKVSAEWDGVYRRLWADDQEVAKDALPTALPPFSWNGTLIVGAGPNLEPGTFFSGLIDDVRVESRTPKP